MHIFLFIFNINLCEHASFYIFLHHMTLLSVHGALKLYKTREQKKLICIKPEEKDEAYRAGSGGWGVTGRGWAKSWGTAAKRKQLLQWPYLKLSLFLQWLHLGLIGLRCITFRNTFPLHFLNDHDCLPLPKAAGRKHVRPHAISKIHYLQGKNKKIKNVYFQQIYNDLNGVLKLHISWNFLSAAVKIRYHV